MLTFADFKTHGAGLAKRILAPEIDRLILNMYLQISHAVFSRASFPVTSLRARAPTLQFAAGLRVPTEVV